MLFWRYVFHLHGLFYKGNFVLSSEEYLSSLRRNQLVPFMQALVKDRHLVSFYVDTSLLAFVIGQLKYLSGVKVILGVR